jgi:hypothetical protein
LDGKFFFKNIFRLKYGDYKCFFLKWKITIVEKRVQDVLKLTKGTKSIEQKGQTLNKSNKKTLTGKCKHNTYGGKTNGYDKIGATV